MGHTEEFIVVKDAGLFTEEVFYAGHDEVEALRSYRRIKQGKKNIFKANIERVLFNNVPFIDTYEVVKVIR